MSLLLLPIETLYIFRTFLSIEDQYKLKAVYTKLSDITFRILDIDPLYRIYFNENKTPQLLTLASFWPMLYKDLSYPDINVTYTIFYSQSEDLVVHAIRANYIDMIKSMLTLHYMDARRLPKVMYCYVYIPRPSWEILTFTLSIYCETGKVQVQCFCDSWSNIYMYFKNEVFLINSMFEDFIQYVTVASVLEINETKENFMYEAHQSPIGDSLSHQ